MEESISNDLFLDANHFKFAIVGIILAIIFSIIAKYIFKISERSKYNLDFIAIIFMIVAVICILPLFYVAFKIALWLLLIGIVLYIGYKLISDFK